MGIIKFEVEMPEFENNLSMTIILKKDGEVVESISHPSIEKEPSVEVKKTRSIKKNLTSPPKNDVGGGNFMNVDFDNV